MTAKGSFDPAGFAAQPIGNEEQRLRILLDKQEKFGNKGDVFLNRFLSDWPTHNVSIVQLSGPSVGAANPQHIDDATIVQAVQGARTTLGAESCRNWANVQRELVGQSLVLPLAIEQVHWFSRNGVDFWPSASVGYTDALTLRRTS